MSNARNWNTRPFFYFSILFIAIAGVLLFSCSRKQREILAITHVTLIDGTGSPPKSDQTVIVEKQRISAIGPSGQTEIPRLAYILNATGKFLIPGFADMHVHLTGAGEPGGSREFIVPLLVAHGITTVRDMGGYLESLIPLRKEIETGKRLGPQIFFAGPYLDGSPPSFQPSLVVTNAAEASEDVRELLQRKVDFIKVQSMLSRDAYFAIAAACQREHITFVGHVPDHVTAAEASDTGQKSIEHLTGVLRACSQDEPKLMREEFFMPAQQQTSAQSQARELDWQKELLATYSGKNATALLEKFARNQTWQVPTLITLRNVAFPVPENDPTNDPRIRLVPRRLLENWRKAYATKMNSASTAEITLRKALFAKSLGIVGLMQTSGVKLLAGTDTAAPFVFPGASLHEELALFVQAGLTPMQALQAATKQPAEFLSKLETQGTVEPGKRADLVLLDANPLDDIHNTQKIDAVVIRGHLLNRSDLDGLLATAQKFAEKN